MNDYERSFRAALGFKNQEKLKKYFKATDFVVVNWERIQQCNIRLEEICKKINQAIYVSATPGEYELEHSPKPAEQVIRPTGLLDPEIEVRSSRGQIDDLMEEIDKRIAKGQRTLITTLT